MGQTEPRALTTSAGPEALEEIGTLLDQTWAETAYVPETIRMQMGIAVGEIAANIVEHATDGRAVQIQVAVLTLPAEVRVEFVDDGQPFAGELDSAHLPDELAERGRGLALARAVLERLEYRRDTHNHWTLVSKSFGGI